MSTVITIYNLILLFFIGVEHPYLMKQAKSGEIKGMMFLLVLGIGFSLTMLFCIGSILYKGLISI